MEKLPVKELKQSGDAITKNSITIVVASPAQVEEAKNFIRSVKALQVKVQETFRPHIQQANKIWKDLIAEEKKHLTPLTNAEMVVKKKISTYYDEAEAERAASQKKLDEENEKEEIKKRQKLIKQAEKEEAKGNTEKADALRSDAENVHLPKPILSGPEKSEGLSRRDNWKAEVVNEAVFIQAVIDGKLPRVCIKADLVALNKLSDYEKVESTRHGVRFYNDKIVNVR